MQLCFIRNAYCHISCNTHPSIVLTHSHVSEKNPAAQTAIAWQPRFQSAHPESTPSRQTTVTISYSPTVLQLNCAATNIQIQGFIELDARPSPRRMCSGMIRGRCNLSPPLLMLTCNRIRTSPGIHQQANAILCFIEQPVLLQTPHCHLLLQ